MECDRLKRLIKNWYSQVQEETMAPARMITFMRQHVADCATCLGDPFVRPEIDKITNIVLPPEKTDNAGTEDSAKAVTAKKQEDDADPEENEENDDEEEEEEESDDDDY